MVCARDEAVVPISARVTVTTWPSVVATSTLTVRVSDRRRVVDGNNIGRLGPAKRVELHLRNKEQLIRVVSAMNEGGRCLV